ncbi:imidazolonepropionase [Chryseolinea sp. H1M3-3]|uniref:imidazolonepropionase n=1 Tax=Chryseolinea sp. H1M3-3 TaxID=3034144 RepID=UPI0023EDFCAC|nr:imidazolonepropionase [Chryseolinea sp. H1M3-3]
MRATLLKNIDQLVNVREDDVLLRGNALAALPIISKAWLLVEDGRIIDYGPMDAMSKTLPAGCDAIDLTGRLVLPAWCDSHTHLVFAASREEEFVDKIKGLSYAQIAAKGGGILNSAAKLKDASEDELFQAAWKRLEQISKMGTGAVEIKSGYGLSTQGELKMLRVIKKLKEKSNVLVKATFLGAHTYPLQFKNDHQGYIRLIIDEMLPRIAEEKLADYVDVFCEEGFFSPIETVQICQAAKQYGLKPKLHANQLHCSGGVQAGVAVNALSVDHLESLDDHAIQALSNATTIGTMLPNAAFFLRMQYPLARKLIDTGAAVALASDYNPGSSPSGNMNLVVAMGCIKMRMLPEEAINAATINGAFAMELQNEVGSIRRGKRANLIITAPVNSIAYLPYSFGENWIDQVMLNGGFV